MDCPGNFLSSTEGMHQADTCTCSFWGYMIDLSERWRPAIFTVPSLDASTNIRTVLGPHEKNPNPGILCYVCLSFLGLLEALPGKLLDERGYFSILWLMKRTTMSTNGRSEDEPGGPNSYVWRSVEFRSTMNHLAIPESGIEFFTLFVCSAREIWKQVLEDSKSHLVKRVQHSDTTSRPITDLL